MQSSRLQSKNNDVFQFKALQANDGDLLGHFFLNLSDDTKSKFGPHPLTMEYAHYICSITDNTIQRFIVHNETEIAGYFILDFNRYNNEIVRYRQFGIELTPEFAPVFAPCIADQYQNNGIASRAMRKIILIAKESNLRSIVLMGGTQEPNVLARSFYAKFGFKEYGLFYTDYNKLNNIDMMLTL